MKKTIHSKYSDILRKHLKKMRAKAGLTQRELAKKLGTLHSFIAKSELGERRLDLIEFYWICEGCGLSPVNQYKKLIDEFES